MNAYTYSKGLDHVSSFFKPLDRRVSKALAMKHTHDAPCDISESYFAFKQQLFNQYRDLIGFTGVEVTAWPDVYPNHPFPYNTLADIKRDVVENNRFYFYPTDTGFGNEGDDIDRNHPLLEDSGVRLSNGRALLYNDIFRIVHDFYGHLATDAELDEPGEQMAWMNHMHYFSQDAQDALYNETLSQSSWVFNHTPNLWKIEDIFNPDTPQWYREQLAGQLTYAKQRYDLHNPAIFYFAILEEMGM